MKTSSKSDPGNTPPDDPTLHLLVLGPLLTEVQGQPVVISSLKAQALLVLLSRRRDHQAPREVLTRLLWPDSAEPQARASLRQALSALRHNLRAAKSAILSEGDRLTLADKTVSLDVSEFERLAAIDDAESLTAAAGLYRGDFAEGFPTVTPEFDRWVETERAYLRSQVSALLLRLCDAQAALGHIEASIATAHRLIAVDPLQEHVHRRLMGGYLQLKRFDAALKQFDSLKAVLDQELGVAPEQTTLDLARQAREERANRTRPDRAERPAKSGISQIVRVATSRDGTRIAYATTGQGPPLLRANHWLTHLEFDWASPVWRPLLDRLGRSFSLTRYDQRCTGLSETGDNRTLEALVDDLEAVANAAGLERFPIFAASQGVPVAIAFAAQHPERVTRLALYGGFAQGRAVRGTEEEKQNAQASLTLIRQGWGRSGSAFAAAFATIQMPDASKEEMQHMVDLQLATATPENVVATRMALDQLDVTDLLFQVAAPTLVLHAREDSVQPLEQARLVAAGIRGAELRVLESRNHIPLPQHPSWGEMMDAVERFLAWSAD